MVNFQSLLSYTLLSLIGTACAGIGPVTDLTITNAQISPDGYVRVDELVRTRSCCPYPSFSLWLVLMAVEVAGASEDA